MLAQPRVAIGIGVGGYARGYYPPPAYAPYAPPCPGPGYVWVGGYWGPRHVWVNGYWRPPYFGGYAAAPRYIAPGYYGAFRGYDREHWYRGGGREGRGFARGFRR